MAIWAKERRDFLDNPKSWWNDKNDYHIRIGGDGFTAISLCDNYPLLAFNSKPVNSIDELQYYFENGKIENPGKSETEFRAQAWLIKQAKNQKMSLRAGLGLQENPYYDEILFALDEVRISGEDSIKRPDILAVGVHGDKAFPVFIELKCKRKTKELLEQLEKYQAEVNQYKFEFSELLGQCIGRKVEVSNFGKFIVWPNTLSGKTSPIVDTEGQCRQASITIVESNSHDWSKIPWSDIKDSPFYVLNGKVRPPTPYKGN